MLRLALVFLVVAIISALLGFTGIAGESMAFARILFYIFLVLFLIGLIWGLVTGRTPPTGV